VALLDIENMHSYYGNIHALRGISLTVEEGEVVTLIGSNGACKTTTLRSIHGVLQLREGKVIFGGEEIQGLPAHDMISRGIAQSPEGRKIFSRMSVLENLEMGAYHRNDRPGIREDMDRVYALFPRLKERTKQEAGTMSGGEQQMLAIGRALMSRPKLLLLDEPSMGLAPVLVERIFDIIKEINTQGTTILLVEQNANVALEIATRGYVMETGSIVNSSSAEKLREDPKVREAYLGEM
jgi:branched-chain amino acid transport system ATP-binding protein